MRRTSVPAVSVLAFAVLLPLCLYALTFVEVEKTCPLCQHKFTCTLAKSGYTSDTRLDLKPLGRTAAPSPVPVCPKCGFVIHADEIGAEELEKCRKLVASAEYEKLKGRASYRRLAALYEHLGEEDVVLAHCFLKASWQEEDNALYYLEDLEKSLAHFQAYLAKSEGQGDPWQTAQIAVGEILRLLGRFTEAAKHFESLTTLTQFQDNFLAQIIRYELKLCEKKDLHHHTISEVKEAAGSE
jgi:hypothetical protein